MTKRQRDILADLLALFGAVAVGAFWVMVWQPGVLLWIGLVCFVAAVQIAPRGGGT
jgi:1,4-dihydroxy-2-naphthoate octaprenyltransferase